MLNLSKMPFKWIALIALSTLLAQSSKADVSSLVGDVDGFGIPGAPANPANGSDFLAIGGAISGDYRSAADLANAPFTDIWTYHQNTGDVGYNHVYSLLGQTPLVATLSIQEAGMSDARGPWNVLFNGTSIGQIGVFSSTFGTTIQTLSWNVPIGLLTGNDHISLVYDTTIDASEGYAINYSQLSIQATPEPSTLMIASCAGLGLVASRLRKR